MTFDTKNAGTEMYNWVRYLFPICRSITGDGFRKSLKYLFDKIEGGKVHEIESGEKVFDWVVPDEWNIEDASIQVNGHRVVDFMKNNLHVVGYSEPFSGRVTFEKLKEHLHVHPRISNAIPYVTSYYNRHWGFCLSQEDLASLPHTDFYVQIDSTLKKGHMTFGELVIEGNSEQEVFFSTYLCHPSMANNELSGPVLATAIIQWLQSLKNLRYTYRFIFIPETIGSILYLSKNLQHLKKNTIAGFNLTCVGDNRTFSFMPSRTGKTYADQLCRKVLADQNIQFNEYSFLDRGSDERQYCHPAIDLPVASIMRSKYHSYPEYHTSLDDLTVVSPEGFQRTFDVYMKMIDMIESNYKWRNTVVCEPNLGRRGLYPKISGVEDSTKYQSNQITHFKNFMAYADGNLDTLGLSDKIGISFEKTNHVAQTLELNLLLTRMELE